MRKKGIKTSTAGTHEEIGKKKNWGKSLEEGRNRLGKVL